jgi:hypothetical protein
MNELDSLRQEAETLKNAIRVSVTKVQKAPSSRSPTAFARNNDFSKEIATWNTDKSYQERSRREWGIRRATWPAREGPRRGAGVKAPREKVQRAFVRSGRLHFACEHTQLVTQEAFTHVRRCLSDGRLDCHVVLIRYPALSTLPHWCGVAGWAAGRDRSGGDGQGLPTVEERHKITNRDFRSGKCGVCTDGIWPENWMS